MSLRSRDTNLAKIEEESRFGKRDNQRDLSSPFTVTWIAALPTPRPQHPHVVYQSTLFGPMMRPFEASSTSYPSHRVSSDVLLNPSFWGDNRRFPRKPSMRPIFRNKWNV